MVEVGFVIVMSGYRGHSNSCSSTWDAHDRCAIPSGINWMWGDECTDPRNLALYGVLAYVHRVFYSNGLERIVRNQEKGLGSPRKVSQFSDCDCVV